MNDLQWRELVEATRRGDKKAFEALYRETERSVYFTCLKLLANEDSAKDAMQDTFMTALDKLDTLDDGAKFPKWINRIAVNKSMDMFRKGSDASLDEQIEQGSEFKDDESFIPEEYVTDETKRKLIMHIINEVLSDVQRQTVIMYYYDEMSVDEIAQAMGCPSKTVSSRLHSSREKIKEAVLIYEKKSGDRLHMLIPVPILTEILRKEAASISVPDISQVLITSHFFNAAANASATSTVSATVAGGSVKMGFLTGKVVAALAAGVIAVGGVTTAIVLSKGGKNSDSAITTSSSVSVSDKSSGSAKDTSSEAGSESKADNSSKADDSKPGDTGYPEPEAEKNGKVYKWGGAGQTANIILPPQYEQLQKNQQCRDFYQAGATSNSYYGILELAYTSVESYKSWTTEQVKEEFTKHASRYDLFNIMPAIMSKESTDVTDTKTLTIDGCEFIRESGTIKMTDYEDTIDVAYTAYFGKVNFADSSTGKSDKSCPAVILAYSTNTSAEKRAELAKTADNAVSCLGKSDAEAESFAKSVTNEYKVEENIPVSVTAPNGTKGSTIKSGFYTVLLPEKWYAYGLGYGRIDPSTIHLNTQSYSVSVIIRTGDDNNTSRWLGSDIDSYKDKPENQMSDLEFTCGDRTWTGIQYKCEVFRGEPLRDGFTVVCKDKTGNGPCVYAQVHGVAYDSAIAQDILSSLKVESYAYKVK